MTMASGGSIGGALRSLQAKWGWIVALGVIYVLGGLVALSNEVLSTFVSLAIIGAMMFVAGAVEIVSAFQMKSWGSFFLWILLGLLYCIAGALVFYNPLLAVSVITLVIGAALVASGIVRFILAFQLPKESPRLLVALSAVVTLLLGGIILAQWPVSSLFMLGIFLGVDLLISGFGWISVGLALKNRNG